MGLKPRKMHAFCYCIGFADLDNGQSCQQHCIANQSGIECLVSRAFSCLSDPNLCGIPPKREGTANNETAVNIPGHCLSTGARSGHRNHGQTVVQGVMSSWCAVPEGNVKFQSTLWSPQFQTLIA